jgi:hypothetical protein
MRSGYAAVVLSLSAALVSGAPPAGAQTVEGFTSLPAETFAPGPTSGQFIAPANGRIPPFVDKQPVQGVSSVLRTSNGDFLVMSDNGFGSKPTSPDYVLRVYRISPNFKTKTGGAGVAAVDGWITLSDPSDHISFPIVADMTAYPGSAIPVDASIVAQRLLTGWDFDIESVREAHDGTLWFGDEFGPFLIHTDSEGRVLEPPIELPGVRAPQNPNLGAGTPNLLSSKGFEGMAISPNGKTLYPMLEGALTTDADQHRLRIFEFDLRAKAYTGRQWWYRLEASSASGQAIGDLTSVDASRFVVIERDPFQGAAAIFKKIFLVDLNETDAAGFLVKRQVADLMNLKDPYGLAPGGATFTFPFVTIESVIPLGRRHIGVLNDNNYPFSSGRTPGQPDPNEFIILRLDEPLAP